MIEAIKEIGEYVLEKKKQLVLDPTSFSLDDPSNKKTKNLLFIFIKSGTNGFSYEGVEPEPFSKSRLEDYIYKKGSPNGPDLTPTSMITSIDKTFKKKLLGWFSKYASNVEDQFLHSLSECMEQNADKILIDLKKWSGEDNNILSLKIDGKYLGEYSIFLKLLKEKNQESYYLKYGKISLSENRICSVCGKQKDKVYGFVSTFKFYTVDKPGFVSGGFNQADAWKNYPVCFECAELLELGKKYLEKNLNFERAYGFRYLLIPKFLKNVDGSTRNKIHKLMEYRQDPSFKKSTIKKILGTEDEILELICKEDNYLTLDFMFYEAPKGFDGAVFNILLYIEDILPSRLRFLFEVKDKFDKTPLFRDCLVPVFENKKPVGEKPLEFNLGILRLFFPRLSDNNTNDEYFLDLTGKIFTGQKLDYDFLMKFIAGKIRNSFVNGKSSKIPTLSGFMLLNYLKELKLIDIMGDDLAVSDSSFFGGDQTALEQKNNAFFNKFLGFFNSPARKAVFLEGVLAQFLLNIQRRERGSEPFRVNLKGLNLDKRQVEAILPKIQNKLEEYGKNYYKSLEMQISKHLIEAGPTWNMSNDEISFYFILGMNLSQYFKLGKETNSS